MTATAKQPLPASMSMSEQKRRDALEKVIDGERAGMEKSFERVGKALDELREKRLYRSSHSTFEDYVRDRHGWTRGRAYQLMQRAGAAEIARALGMTPPATESEAAEVKKELTGDDETVATLKRNLSSMSAKEKLQKRQEAEQRALERQARPPATKDLVEALVEDLRRAEKKAQKLPETQYDAVKLGEVKEGIRMALRGAEGL